MRFRAMNDQRGDPMAKQGMKRPERTHVKPRNELPPVPELQGKVRKGKKTGMMPAAFPTK